MGAVLGDHHHAHPRQRIRGRAHASGCPPNLQAAPAAEARFARRRARSRTHHGDRADPHLLRRGSDSDGGTPRGPCARKHGSSDPLRDAYRFPGRRRRAARRLIGVIEHPLNRPRFDPKLRRVVEGYGILQPRVSVTLASAAGSPFARAYAGHTGVDSYTTAVSDTYQDLFGEGSFTGKGLYDVDAFSAALEGRVPENALLSHDLFEGLHARCALISDA